MSTLFPISKMSGTVSGILRLAAWCQKSIYPHSSFPSPFDVPGYSIDFYPGPDFECHGKDDYCDPTNNRHFFAIVTRLLPVAHNPMPHPRLPENHPLRHRLHHPRCLPYLQATFFLPSDLPSAVPSTVPSDFPSLAPSAQPNSKNGLTAASRGDNPPAEEPTSMGTIGAMASIGAIGLAALGYVGYLPSMEAKEE